MPSKRIVFFLSIFLDRDECVEWTVNCRDNGTCLNEQGGHRCITPEALAQCPGSMLFDWMIDCDVGLDRGHMNYNIKNIVVILKMTMRFFLFFNYNLGFPGGGTWILLEVFKTHAKYDLPSAGKTTPKQEFCAILPQNLPLNKLFLGTCLVAFEKSDP